MIVIRTMQEAATVYSGPVHWGSYPGEFLERLMAVLVAQDHPGVIRRTPASGDGGVDLLVPNDDGYDVEQVKGFHDRLGTSEKAQIEKSWKSITTKPRLGKPIKAYRLVVPVDPTPDEQKWFETLTKDASFPVSFCGKPHWDSLAAQQPHVIDYMIAGGRDRVIQRSRALLSTAIDPSRPISPLDVAASLETLRQSLNREDPHYRYEFMTSATEPKREALEDCAVAETRQTSDGAFLTIKVIPRHKYALDDEPIAGTLTIRLEDPAHVLEFNEAFSEFRDFGRALDIPDGALFTSVDLPGGLGGNVEGGGGWIGPALVENPPQAWRLGVRDRRGELATIVPLKTTSLTRGVAGGAELIAHDTSGVLEVRIRLHPPKSGEGAMDFNVTLADPTGHRVIDVAEPLDAMSQLSEGNRLVLLGEFGTKDLASHTFDTESSLVPRPVALHIQDLATIQRFADFPIVVPAHVEAEFARDLREPARMLRGEVVTGTWDEITLHIKADVERDIALEQFKEQAAFAAEETRWVEIEGQRVDLGPFTSTLASARLADDQPEDPALIRLVPGSTHTMTRRRGAISEET